MVFVAYLCLLAAVIWLFQGGDALPVDKRAEAPARLIAALIGTALAAVGLIQLSRHTAQTAGTAILIVLAIGGCLYVSGVLWWEGRVGYWLRMIGWMGMIIPLLIPSTLSLTLPLVALLALTLRIRTRRGDLRSRRAP